MLARPHEPREESEPHTRILRVTLEADNAREYWRHSQAHTPTANRVEQAFTGYWFGERSMPRIRTLLANFDRRFAAFPAALAALHMWSNIDGETRRVLCHWHVQLADPIYRAFAGDFCAERREGGRPLTRDLVLRWVRKLDTAERWSATTQAQFASKLLSCAYAAGLVETRRDPRRLQTPRVTPGALGYLLHALRTISIRGTLYDNPYLRSVGLVGTMLDARMRTLPGISIRRAGGLVELEFEHPTAVAWVRATQGTP